MGLLGRKARPRVLGRIDLKLAINCLSINTTSALGVRNFLIALLQQFPSISLGFWHEVELLFIVQKQSALKADIESALSGSSRFVRVNIIEINGIRRSTRRVLYEQFVLPLHLRGYDTVYSINNANPLLLFGSTRSVVSILDLLPFKAGARYGLLQKTYLRLFTKLCARRAEKIITISHCTKNEIVELLKVSPAKIFIIYPCLPFPFVEKTSYADRYLLVIGGLNEDKRVDSILRGFAAFRVRNPDSTLKLVIAGPDQGAKQQLEDMACELNLTQTTSFLGQVSEDRKNELLAGCLAIVMMGRSEGFGIPVLEAMRFGKPSLVADAGALPEISGKAGVVVRTPENAEQVAEGINSLCESRTDWITTCREEYARFRIEVSSLAFWTELLNQQHPNG